MAARRILLLGEGDLTDETCAALEAGRRDRAAARRPLRTTSCARRSAAGRRDAVAVVSRDDAWPLRAALLVRHLDADVPIVATIFDPATGRELEQEIGNCTITSLADIVAPSLAGPCLGDELAAVLDGDPPKGCAASDGGRRGAGPAGGASAPRSGAHHRDPEARSTAARRSSSSAPSGCC